jgi:tetratricopeptide (TPR) repeat protein
MDSFDVMMKVDDLIDKGKAQEGLDLVAPYLEKDSDDILLLQAKGKCLLNLGDAKGAFEQFDKATKNPFDAAYPYFWRGAAFGKLGKKKEMFEDLARAIARDKDAAREAVQSWGYMQWLDDPEFLETIDAPGNPTLSPVVMDLVALQNEDEWFGVFETAIDNIDNKEDPLSILDAGIEALEIITEDIEEHGEANLNMYGDGKYTNKQFYDYLKQFKEKRLKLAPAKLLSPYGIARSRHKLGLDK